LYLEKKDPKLFEERKFQDINEFSGLLYSVSPFERQYMKNSQKSAMSADNERKESVLRQLFPNEIKYTGVVIEVKSEETAVKSVLSPSVKETFEV
jgi:hypothetical protein